jgi:tetratricopeptide (TPR) repeat protein
MAAIVFAVLLVGGITSAVQEAQEALPPLIEKARAAEKTDNLNEAARAYERILQIRPHWAAVEFNLGLVYFSQKRYSDAVRLYTQALQDNPSLVEAYRSRGIAYYHSSQYGEALSSLKRFLDLRPMDQEAHFALATTYYALGDYGNAALEYVAQMQISPNQSSVYYYLSKTYRALAVEALKELEMQKALPERKAALEADFNKELQQCRQVQHVAKGPAGVACLVDQGDFAKATSVLAVAQSHASHDPRAEYVCLRLYSVMAEQAFAKLAALSPDSYLVAMLRAANLQRERKYTDADREYELAGRLGGDDPDVFIEHGKLKDAMGRFREAIPLFQKALGLDPANPRVRSLLGEAYWMSGQPEAALPLLQEVIRSNPNDAQSRIYAAEASDSLHHTDDAIKTLEEAPSDNDGRIHFLLAKYYSRQGKKEDAARALEYFHQHQQEKK